MKRALSLLAALMLVLGIGVTMTTTAAAAPPTAAWRATAGGDVVNVGLSAVGIDLAGVRLATSLADSGSQLDPRSRSQSLNLGAAVAGISLPVASHTVDAPPGGGPETTNLLGLDVLGAVTLDALTATNEAHWSGDDVCTIGEVLADTSTETAGVSVGVPLVPVDILTTGVSRTAGTTELVSSGSGLNYNVRSTASGQITGIEVLEAVTITVGGTPSLVATSDGTQAGSGATYNSSLITVTWPGNSVTLAPGVDVEISLLGLGTVTVTAGQPTTSVSPTGAVTSTVSVVSVEVSAAFGAVEANVDLLPLRASASAPAEALPITGGIDCPPPAPTIDTPADGSTTADTTPEIAGEGTPGATIDLTINGTVVPNAATVAGDGSWSYVPSTPLTSGDYTVTAIQSLNGANSPPSAETTFTIDATAPAAPVLQTPADGSTTADRTPTVSGTAEAGSTVEVFLDGTSVGTTTATAGGTFSFDLPDDLADGTYEVYVTATDDLGNTSPESNTNSFTVDGTAPAAPIVVSPADGSAGNDSTPTILGTAEANTVVEVFIDGASIGEVTSDGTGNWSLVAPELADGEHTVHAIAIDAVGNASAESNTNTFTVDTTAPAAPAITAPADGSVTNEVTPLITGTGEPGATVTVTVDGTVLANDVLVAADGTWQVQVDQPLTEGPHTIEAFQVSVVGNTSPTASSTFAVDLTEPAAPVIEVPTDGDVLADNSPTISGTAEPGADVEVFLGAVSVGTATADGGGAWTLDVAGPLPDGDYTATAVATDPAGNTSEPSAAVAFTIDTTEPAPPVITAPAEGDVTSAQPEITGTAEPNSVVTVSIDDVEIGTAETDGAGNWTLVVSTPLAEGDHTVTATATDPAGNESAPSEPVTFAVDLTAPDAPVVTTPADGSVISDPTPSVTGTAEANSSVEVFIDGVTAGTVIADGAGIWTLPQTSVLDEGEHTVSAQATDSVGNVSEVSAINTFTVDVTAPPAPTITSPTPGQVIGDNTPTITGTGEPGATVEVSIDGVVIGTTEVDPGGAWTLDVTDELADGPRVIEATQTDEAGNTSEETSVTFVVDTEAPAAPVISAPTEGAVLPAGDVTVSGTGEPGAAVTVTDGDGTSYGPVTVQPTGLWSVVLPGLTDGSYTVVAVQTDPAGNESAASEPRTFSVDASAPAAPVVTAPADGAVIADSTPTIDGTGEPGAEVTVSLNGEEVGTATVAADGTWSLPLTDPLVDGPYIVTATQTDGVGNESAESAPVTFTVDTTAPAAPVITAPTEGQVINNPTPTITGTGEVGLTVTVMVDDAVVGTAVVGGDGTWTLPTTAVLPDGPHRVNATQADAVGNVSAAGEVTFVVDTAEPGPPTIETPADGTTVTDSTPVVSGTGEPGATVTVEVDGEPVGTTTVGDDGSWTLTPTEDLADGPHTVTATQTDPAGNTSPPGTSTFTVDTTAPAVPVITAPADGDETGELITVSGTAEPGSTVTVLVDGEPVGTTGAGSDGTWMLELPEPLDPGPHVLTATATDENGNVSEPSDEVNIEVRNIASPVIVTPADDSEVQTSPSVISGTAEPEAAIEVRVVEANSSIGTPNYGPSDVVGTAVADEDGNWSITPAEGFLIGEYVIVAEQSLLGFEDRDSPLLSFAVIEAVDPDSEAPAITSPGDGDTLDESPVRICGTGEPGAFIGVVSSDGEILGDTEVGEDGTWCVAALLPDGEHEVIAVQVDEDGAIQNSDPIAFVVDAVDDSGNGGSGNNDSGNGGSGNGGSGGNGPGGSGSGGDDLANTGGLGIGWSAAGLLLVGAGIALLGIRRTRPRPTLVRLEDDRW